MTRTLRLLILAALLLAALALPIRVAASPVMTLAASATRSELEPGQSVSVTVSVYHTAVDGQFVSVNPELLPDGLRFTSWDSSTHSGWEGASWAGVVAYDQPVTLQLTLEATAGMVPSRTPRQVCFYATDETPDQARSCFTLRVDRPSVQFLPVVANGAPPSR